ncbi:MAG: hypothetical protein RR891_08430 [Clostridium sp.]
MIGLTSIHYIYLIFILIILIAMIKKRDVSLICIIGIFIIALISTKSIPLSVISLFNGFIYAITELLPTILIISIIAALSKILRYTGINRVMISPFAKLIKNDFMAFWIIGLIMMVASYFFWPSPAVALVGAVLVPVAIKAGLPAIGAAIAMNLFGHGIALSTDFIIQAAPKLTADAAGVSVQSVVAASVPLIIVMGLVTTITAFIMLKRDMKNGTLENLVYDEKLDEEDEINELVLSKGWKIAFAILVPALFIVDVFIMISLGLKGGDATALIGGTTLFLLMAIAIKTYKNSSLEELTTHFVSGLQFAFKVFGIVIPIAAFFYIGDSGFLTIIGKFLPEGSLGIVNDLGFALSQTVPLNNIFSAFTVTGIGAITGLDGSGFSGISLAGSTAKLFGTATGASIPTLTALGQIAAIWVGGGTIIPWAIIPVSAICKVSPFELAKRNFKPVVLGLIVTSLFALFLL